MTREQLETAYIPEPNSGCWIWLRATIGHGYGWVKFDGKKDLAHRVFYRLAKGPIPEGHEIDHLCRTKVCCNPDHLEAVPHAENLRRAKDIPRPKKKCKNGHDFPPKNAGRSCKICHEAYRRAHRIEKNAYESARRARKRAEQRLMHY